MSEALLEIQWINHSPPRIKSPSIKFALVTAIGLTLLIVGILANQNVEGLSSLDSEAQWGLISAGSATLVLYYLGFYFYHFHPKRILTLESSIATCGEIKDNEQDKYKKIWSYLKNENVHLAHFFSLPYKLFNETFLEKTSNRPSLGYIWHDLEINRNKIPGSFESKEITNSIFWNKDLKLGPIKIHENGDNLISFADRDIDFSRPSYSRYTPHITKVLVGHLPDIVDSSNKPLCTIRKYRMEIYPPHWSISKYLYE